MSKARRLGWLPDLPDQRDLSYAVPVSVMAALPVRVDLRSGCGPIYDQGDLGSCTANGIASAHEFCQRREGPGAFTPSRLFIYFEERNLEGTVNEDAGAYIRDGIKVIANRGVCRETTWPYVTSRFRNKPTAKAYDEALRHQSLIYRRVNQRLDDIRGCLAAGFPVVFGWSVYESAQTSAVMRSGDRPMPHASERLLGGHCEKLVGYDDTRRRFIVKGSWGRGVGKAGYFTMPYDYMVDDNLSADFWTIRLVERV